MITVFVGVQSNTSITLALISDSSIWFSELKIYVKIVSVFPLVEIKSIL